jgi:nucleotide-binding universal stress UspA family protein
MQSPEIKHVLAAVDFSEWTPPVLRSAAHLADQYGASLSALYSEPFLPPPYFTEGELGSISAFLEAQRRAAGRHLEGVVREVLGGRQVHTLLEDRLPVEGILRAARSQQAGLIALGTHGRSGLNRLLLGSVAEKVLRQSPVPVLTARPHTAPPFRRLLCPVNHTPVALEALGYAADLAGRGGAELVLLHIDEGAGAPDPEQLCALVPPSLRARCALRALGRRGEAAEQILQVAAEERSDLIVLGAQHRPLLETTILGTTSVRVMRHAPAAVLTVVRAHESAGGIG